MFSRPQCLRSLSIYIQTNKMSIHVVDDQRSITHFLNSITNQSKFPPSLYLDIEGVNLCREGSISIVQVYNKDTKEIFLVDVFTLQGKAFDTSNARRVSSRSILEDPATPKVFFDVRNDSDALFAHFKVKLRGIHDVQLFKAGTQPNHGHLPGLAQCIEQDAGLSPEVQASFDTIKAKGKRSFAPERGGSYEVFNERPMPQEIIDYCSHDVMYLAVLWETYFARLWSKSKLRVKEETMVRVIESQTQVYVPNGYHKRYSVLAGSGHTESYLLAKSMLDAEVANQKQIMELRHRRRQTHPSPKVSGPKIARNLSTCIKSTYSKVLEVRPATPSSDSAGELASDGDKWFCRACHLYMRPTAKTGHLAGKKHLAMVKKHTMSDDFPPLASAAVKAQISNSIATSSAMAKSGVLDSVGVIAQALAITSLVPRE